MTPYLYSLWVLTSSITVELFADALNESGVMPVYCSQEYDDHVFGSLGAWEDVENRFEGAGGNPPFERSFLQRMVTEFDNAAIGSSPYCRCVLLPLSGMYGMIDRTSGLSSQGIMLVTIPPGSLSFRQQEGYFTSRSLKVYHGFQELGLFIWRNRPYMEKYPPPMDVELLYLHWVAVACRNPSKVNVDVEALQIAFPPSLRQTSNKLGLCMKYAMCE